MPNFIEDSNMFADRFVSALSRYRNSGVVYYQIGTNRKITFKTYKKKNYPLMESDTYGVIPLGMQYRPDKMSQKFYGTPDFWWKIMEVNNIKDIYDFKAGKTVRLPSSIF